MATDQQPLRVVVVEDSEAYLMRLRLALSDFPQLSLLGTVESAASAIDLLNRTEPDLVLLDLYLKEGSGLDVLRHIRASGLKAKVLVMTSEQSPEMRTACLDLGAHSFLDKVGLIHALAEETDGLLRELSAA